MNLVKPLYIWLKFYTTHQILLLIYQKFLENVFRRQRDD